MQTKYAVPYRCRAPMGGVALTGGRFQKAFENNTRFLKGFDLDRMLYWYRVHAGKPAPGVPYAAQAGHFENNLKGQTAGAFLMGAGTTLLWQEDETLRTMAHALLAEMQACRDADGFILPIAREAFKTKEYPNYTRAWITFGLLDAGYAGETLAFQLARDMGDWFNQCDFLPYVKDMNLGFQGILANTRLYDAPVGVPKDIQVAIDHYQETWWLQQLIERDHRAIYDHPGNHPHSTLLTTLEGYLDLYRVTGKPLYRDAVRAALSLYADKWQHVGGGISMCEYDHYYPGCNWLSHSHHYNELCSTNFWVLLHQRMHLLEPDDTHPVDEMENSLYNVLLASQVGDQGYHYLNFLEQGKDDRWVDRCTCCAGLGTRLAGLLPQFLYTYNDTAVYADLYAPSVARLPLAAGTVEIHCETRLPEAGGVTLTIREAPAPFTLHLRIPRWAAQHAAIFRNGEQAALGQPATYVAVQASRGDRFDFAFPMRLKTTLYTGGEEIPHQQRYAVEYGPLLYAAMGAPNPVSVAWDPQVPEAWFQYVLRHGKPRLILRDDPWHAYWAYLDIGNEPFSVYPIVTRP